MRDEMGIGRMVSRRGGMMFGWGGDGDGDVEGGVGDVLSVGLCEVWSYGVGRRRCAKLGMHGE